MITPQTPIEQSAITNLSAVQQLPASEVTNVLQREGSTDFIKKLVLGYYVKKAIGEAEAKQVVTGVKIIDMQSHKPIVSHNVDTEHFAASVNKLPVALLVLRDLRAGRMTLDQKMTWTATDVRAGAGVYDQPGAPMEATLKEVIFDMLHRSGNTAVRVLVNGGLGGAAAVNERWSTIPELSHTRLQPLDANRFYLGNSTPSDALWTMTELMKKQDSYATFLKDSMKDNIYTDDSVRSQLAGNDYIVLVNKVGLLDDVEGDNRHDVGIIYNTRTHKSYGFSLMTTSPHDNPEATPQAEQSLKDIGRYTLRFSGDKKHRDEAASLRMQTQHEQRTLY